jgi:putative two-component system response regulator
VTPDVDLPRVLIVDDEDSVRNLLALVVSRAGGRPELAHHGAAARDLLARGSYDVALVDKNLPDESGLSLLGWMRQQAPDTQVLIVTGYANMDSAIEALRLGAFDYVVKPFDVATVTHRVKQALERRRLARELEQAFGDLRRMHATVQESREEVKRAYLETVMRLSRAAEYRDQAAGDHIGRLSRYAGILARAVQGRPDWIEDMMYASPLHDIGKLGVPEAVLRKPGPLTPAERRAVEEHVVIGGRILDGVTADVLLLGREIVLTHHERWDGKGYPKGLRADEIPLSGRIVALADSWDAVSTDRPYRRAMPFDGAVEEIQRSAGSSLDPTLVEAFLDSMNLVRAVFSDVNPH